MSNVINSSSKRVYTYYSTTKNTPTHLDYTEVTPYEICSVDSYSTLNYLRYFDSKIIIINDYLYNYSLHIQIRNYRIINIYCLNFIKNNLIDKYNIYDYIKSINEVYFNNTINLYLIEEVIENSFKEIDIYKYLSDYYVVNVFSGYNKNKLSVNFIINDLIFTMHHKFSYAQLIDKDPIDVIKSQLISLVKKINSIKEIEKLSYDKLSRLKLILPSFSNIYFSTKLEAKKIIELITNIGDHPTPNDEIIKRISKGISKCTEYVINEETINKRKLTSKESININLQYGIRYILNREYETSNNTFSNSMSFFLICDNILPATYERCVLLGELFGEEFLIDFYEKLEYKFLKGAT
jgi:hypothetical protein